MDSARTLPVVVPRVLSLREKGAIALALTGYLFLIVKDAWVSDDAYITLRVVDNFTHGYGLTWNVDERVQVFTHPLWMFMLSAFYCVVRDVYFSTILLSVVVSFAAVSIYALFVADSLLQAVIGILALAASKAFIDYSTSGLENPMTYLCIVMFVLVYYRVPQCGHHNLWLAFIAGLATLNRMDTLLLFAPALVTSFLKAPSRKSAIGFLLGFSPFLLWELFAVWYYGFLFPNTAYAKLDTGISSLVMLRQGAGYLASTLTFDPVIFLVFVASSYLVLRHKEWKTVPFLLGIALYIAYTMRVGGDFMAGRFLTEPYLVAVIVLARTLPLSLKSVTLPLATVLVLFAILTPYSRWIGSTHYSIDVNGVVDERSVYVPSTGLFSYKSGKLWPNSGWTSQGLAVAASGQRVVVKSNIGFFGFAAGPRVHIVDANGLADPLLARLPANPGWRIGHFERTIPAGYVESAVIGRTIIENKQIALYDDKLRIITQGSLFDPHRLLEIAKMNLGEYDYLLTDVR
jgi:arabinofuranosyltransferase